MPLTSFFEKLKESDNTIVKHIRGHLEIMNIDLNQLKAVLISGIQKNEEESPLFVSLYHILMAVKLLGYGDTIFSVARELSFSTKDDKKGIVGIGGKKWNDKLSEFRILIWLQVRHSFSNFREELVF